MNERLRNILSPPAEVGKADTSLRYTDILFGFVIRELFIRLQNWTYLDSQARWQLIVGATLVLGSWIGYRRSLNRAEYEVKFFNLPLFRFLLDQLMLIFYFRIAVMTEVNPAKQVPNPDLAANSTRLLTSVFLLYVLWDLLGLLMAKVKVTSRTDRRRKFKYPRVNKDDGTATEEPKDPNYVGMAISVSGFVVLALLSCQASVMNPSWLFATTTGVLLLYRFAKEIRTSWQMA